MRKVWVAGVLFFGFVAPVCAADLPVIAPYYPVRPLYSWTGCSVGVNIGAGGSPKGFSDPNGIYGPAGASLGTHTAKGAVGGWQIGCDYQTGPVVFGVRGLYDLSGMKGNNVQPLGPLPALGPAGALANFSFIQWVGTLSGRVGVTLRPTTLLYVQGGGAWAHDVYNIAPFQAAIVTNALGSSTPAGWTLGAGIEAALFGGDWSVFAEYDHLQFGSSNVTFTSGVIAGRVFPLSISQRTDMFILGLNYRFLGGPPKF
jgi:outer membrane immunogenic protein